MSKYGSKVKKNASSLSARGCLLCGSKCSSGCGTACRDGCSVVHTDIEGQLQV